MWIGRRMWSGSRGTTSYVLGKKTVLFIFEDFSFIIGCFSTLFRFHGHGARKANGGVSWKL
jgi:hypothetical protein